MRKNTNCMIGWAGVGIMLSGSQRTHRILLLQDKEIAGI